LDNSVQVITLSKELSMSRFKFKQVGGARKYRPWRSWAEGDYIIAKFKETYIDKYKNEGWVVEILECEFEEKETEFKEGEVVGLNAAGGLAYAMEEVLPGNIVRIEYTGLDTLDSGDFKGSSVHTFKVGIDDSELDASEVKRIQDEQAKAKTTQAENDSEGDDYDL
jgi:hypothetical protein